MPNPIDVQKTLSGANYACSKQDLIEHAKSNGADDGHPPLIASWISSGLTSRTG